MAIDVYCDLCLKMLTEPGGLFFSTRTLHGQGNKYHQDPRCWQQLIDSSLVHPVSSCPKCGESLQQLGIIVSPPEGQGRVVTVRFLVAREADELERVLPKH